MSYFNEDQRDWMAYLSTLPAEAKCECGWERRGRCYGACYGHPEKGGAPRKTEAEREATRRFIAGKDST